MAIFRLSDSGLTPLEEIRFSTEGLQERRDLQRILRKQVEIVSPDTLAIAEEFGGWEDSRRRIDLLGVDKDANLVVIELKRTEDGGHMDLQSLRYAAMISTLTFEKAVDIYAKHLTAMESAEDPRAVLLDFLGWDEPDEELFGQRVRIVLASAEFSRELTTSVLWLNDQGLDIRCVRLKPYRELDTGVFIDVQQLIPLPEATEYQVSIREKQKKEREAKELNRDTTRYIAAIGGGIIENLPKRWAIYHVVQYLCQQGHSPEELEAAVPWRRNLFRSVDGELTSDEFVAALKDEEIAGGRRFDERRYFSSDEQLIHSKGRTYALTNQWGVRTLEAIGLLANLSPQHEIIVKPQG